MTVCIGPIKVFHLSKRNAPNHISKSNYKTICLPITTTAKKTILSNWKICIKIAAMKFLSKT